MTDIVRGSLIGGFSSNVPSLSPKRSSSVSPSACRTLSRVLSCQARQRRKPRPDPGLGLAIVRDLAGLHDGSIELPSSRPGGPRARLQLPG